MLNAALRATAHAVQRAPRQGLVWLVRAYRFWLQPWLGNVCRYEPSCSAYALHALQQHGAAKGLVLAVWRVLRCNPWSLGGHDPVPAVFPLCCGQTAGMNQNGRGLFTRLVQPEAPSQAVDAAPLNRNQQP